MVTDSGVIMTWARFRVIQDGSSPAAKLVSRDSAISCCTSSASPETGSKRMLIL